MRNKGIYMILLSSAMLLAACAGETEEGDQQSTEPEETEQTTPEIEPEEDEPEVFDYDTIEYTSDVEAQYSTQLNEDILTNHENRQQEILNAYEEGDYTFSEPLVHLDPYGRAPLSALVSFELEDSMDMTVTVEGDTEETTIAHTYTNQSGDVHLPVLGLYPNRENTVMISGETASGETMETTLTLVTDPLPEDLLDFTVKVADPELMAEGLTFIQPSYYPTAVDSNGDVRWFSPVLTYNQLKRLENGNMLLATLEEDRGTHDHLTEMTMLGRVVQSVTIDMANVLDSPTLHHDTIVLPNDNYLALLHDGSENYVEDELVEIDRETGEVVHRINLKDLFPDEIYEEYAERNAEVGDWAHVNTVVKLEDEDAVLLSLRNQDVILKLSYPEPEIEWLLGHTEGWPEALEEYVLEPVNEEVLFHAGPHAVEEMPDQDGDDATLDVLLFDNNSVYSRGDEELSETYSRGVQYRVNQEEGTVDEIWSYGEERGTAFFSRIVGDADYHPDTNTVLLTSGHALDEAANQRNSIMVEVTKTEDPEVVFELWYGPFGENEYFQTYRAERMPLYPE